MKKRVLAILLTLCLVLALCPVTAFAEEPTPMLAIHGADTVCAQQDYEFTVKVTNVEYYNGTEIYAAEDEITGGPTVEVSFDDEGVGHGVVSKDAYASYPNHSFKLFADAKDEEGNHWPVTKIVQISQEHIYVDGVCGCGAVALDIHGADTVCAQQDYEFTVTASEGVTLETEFGYDTGMMGSGVDLTIDEDNVGHGMMKADWYDLDTNRFTLTAHGKTVDGTPVTATKTVQVSQEHIYVDGVCGCGAVLQYTVQYDGGAEFGLYVDFKTHGQDLTLLGETFRRDGYVQTGWVDKDSGAVYDLGDVYTTDADVTLNPVWDKLITVTTPFTVTVEQEDAGEPGEMTFTLEVLDANAGEENYADVTVSGSVTTNGAGTYSGTMTFTGPESQLWYMLAEGALVRQVDDGAEGWTVDDTVYGLIMTQVAAYSLDDAAQSYTLLVVPAVTDDDGNYFIDWDAIDWEQEQTGKMTFTNTYSAHVYELNHDANGHWDECACGDRQNEEPHEYGDWTVTKEATQTAKGEKEHTCTVCGYTETAEIDKLAATDTTTPQTGDSSHMALWMVLLFVSAAGVIGTTVYGKKKRAK